ncbi:patatin-like phospholipase family protein [Alkalicoccus daliensis]|uniref:Predicted phospholipase, patatin/cPLA2 family n=1 Tax=Alkalicoccus daliensis TaxID=745820 RepID=A0A1H0APH5_9BACI|nr:patatin family protein [Alkalicoccus daliensis]SDN35428.1 Predicted phospholipase, patatin/cPLA2 family [Alkalicoccus daliensis]
MEKAGLVLEGGGMRGVFTSGALELLLEKDIQLPYIIGVSAGACNAASYVSRQAGRNKAVTVGYAGHPDYISLKRLLRYGELFNMDLIFDRIPNNENPFNYEQFFSSSQEFYVGVTDCYTGETLYYEKSELRKDFNMILRASSSLPMVAPFVDYKGRRLLDGGISDPIPIKRSITDGNKKHVIILTQQSGYQKTPAKRGMWYFRRKYKDCPGLVKIVQERYEIYNEALLQVKKLEQEGKAFVLRPESLFDVGRTERKAWKLEKLYQHGYEMMKEREEELLAFLKS